MEKWVATHCWWECGTPTLEEFESFFKNQTYNKHQNPRTQQITSRHLSQRNENLCPHKHLHMNAYSSFIQSSPRCPSMGKYLNKLWYNQYYGIGLNNEKETPSDACNNLGKSPENDAEKNPI